MLHVISWSGGKDSTASIILLKEHYDDIVKEGDQVAILFAEVMFDKANNISAHNPDVIKFIYETKKKFEAWGFNVEILRADSDYLTFVHHKMGRSKKHPEHKGMKFGFPIASRGLCGVKRDLKEKPIKAWNKAHKDIPQISYVGIAIDEEDRLEKLYKKPNTVSLLERYGYTEQMARELCEQYGMLSPQYKLGISQTRDGCWMCPWAKYEEHVAVAKAYPEAWKTFVALEDEEGLAYDKWNSYTKETLKNRDQQIQEGIYQFSIFDYFS